MKLTLLFLFATALLVTGRNFRGGKDCANSVAKDGFQGCLDKMNNKIKHNGDPENTCKYMFFWVKCVTRLFHKCGPAVERDSCEGIIQATQNHPMCPNVNCDFLG